MPESSSSRGTLYGIGLGPGDPGLISVHALRLIERLGVLCIPRARGKAGSAARDILHHLTDISTKEILYADYPLTGDRKALDAYWESFAHTLLDRLGKGDDIGYCTIGNPLVYSTWEHVLRVLRGRNASVVTLPGVSSFCLAAARANLPLADLDGSVTICPASVGADVLSETIDRSDCTVIMKLGRHYDEVVSLLESRGLLESSLYAQRVGTPRERAGMNPLKVSTERGREGLMALIIVKKDTET